MRYPYLEMVFAEIAADREKQEFDREFYVNSQGEVEKRLYVNNKQKKRNSGEIKEETE